MTGTDDPYAPPDPDAAPADRHGSGGPPGPAPAPFGAPTGAPAPGAPPPPGGGTDRRALAALVLGVLALVLGVSIIGGLVLGPLAVLLGAGARRRARRDGQSSALALAGIALGLLGLLTALAVYLYAQDELDDYQGCLKESITVSGDERCFDELERSLRP